MVKQIQILKAELFGKSMLDIDDRKIKVNINHVPVMITESGKLLCIPFDKEITHVGITAMTGRGKGVLGNAILCWEFWLNKRLCFILNDFQQETFEMSLPCMNKEFKKNLNIVNVNPLGLPIVYVYPANKDIVIGECENEFPTIKMSLPTRIVITNIEKLFALDKSSRYFTANIDKFLECKDLEEIDEVLKEIIEENVKDYQNKKSLENMMFKIRTTFKNIFDDGYTDNSSPDAPAILSVESKDLPPYKNSEGKLIRYNNLTIQALIAVGLIPSIQTSEIRSKSWFSAYMSFIVDSIYEDKRDDYFFKNKTLRMYVPEIDKMWKGDDGSIIKDKLSLIGTNGRRMGIGMIWDAQDYDAIPDSIRSNTPFMFVLRKANADEVKGIKKDFHVDKQVEDWILTLETDPKKGLFECVALTARKFIMYNLRNGKIEETSYPQKGKLITPMAHHKTPGVPLHDLINYRYA